MMYVWKKALLNIYTTTYHSTTIKEKKKKMKSLGGVEMWYISEPNTKNSRYTAFQAERILRSSRRGALGREQSLPTLYFQKFLPSVTIFQFYLESYIFKTTLSLVTFQTMLTRWQKKKVNILACCTLSSSTNKSRHKISTHFISKTTLHILVLKYMLSLKSYFRCVEFWQL